MGGRGGDLSDSRDARGEGDHAIGVGRQADSDGAGGEIEGIFDGGACTGGRIAGERGGDSREVGDAAEWEWGDSVYADCRGKPRESGIGVGESEFSGGIFA